MNVGAIPEWLATALLAAALATLGFVGKQIVEWVASVYRVQAELRDHLVDAITKRNAELTKGRGFNAVFSSAFPNMNDDERQLHALIRG